MRVLVTGGAGFIGSHLVDRLVAQDAEVTVLDDLSTGRESNLVQHSEAGRVRLVRGSVCDAGLTRSLVASHDLTYHLAAAVGVRHIVAEPIGAIETNVTGTMNVLVAAYEAGRRVLLASTSEVYGKSTDLPFREEGDRVLGPTSKHRWSYSTAKALDEHLALAYADRGLAVTIVRYFNAYGPRLDEGGYGSVIARFAGQALRGDPLTVHGDGRQTRCFTFVRDTVEGTLRAATSADALGQVVNIGSDAEIAIADLARLVVEMSGSRSEISLVPYDSYYPRGYEDTRRRIPDTRRAREMLGFVARTSLSEGLAETLRWCRAAYVSGSRA